MKKALISDEQGQTIIETALSLLLLLTMIFGVIGGALLFNTYHYVSYAARAGSRFAMVRGSKCAGFPSACPAAASDVTNYVQGLAFLGIDPTKITVTTTWTAAPPAGSICASPACNDPGDQVTVTVRYPLSAFAIPILTVPSGNLHSSSTMVITQ